MKKYTKSLRYWIGACIVVLGAAALLLSSKHTSSPNDPAQQRIISIGGNVTEMVYALGLGDSVVATDSTSTYPEAAQSLPKVGYMRTLSVEGVMSLNPTLLVLSGEAGPANVIEQLKSTGVNIIQLPKAHSFENITASINQIGAATKQTERAQQLTAQLQSDWQKAQQDLKSSPLAARKALFVMNHTGKLTVAGRDTAADAVLQLAGLENTAHKAFTGYKTLDAESLITQSPDIIITTSESVESMGGADALLSKAGIAQTNAAKNKRLVAMPAMYLLGFGPRLPAAMAELNKELQ